MFNVHIQSRLLNRTLIRDRESRGGGGGGGGPPALAGTREDEQSDRGR